MAPASLKPPATLQSEVFPLKEIHMYLLQKYVYDGVQLPTNITDYTKELSLATATVNKLKPNIESIVKVYGDIKTHTTKYKTIIHPSTVDLASLIVNYARGAPTYYKGIFDAIIALSEATDPDVIKTKKARVNAIVDVEVKATDEMLIRANKVVAELQQFGNETEADQANLIREDKALDAKLDEYSIEMKNLEKEIAELQKAIDEAEEAFNKTLVATAISPQLTILPFFGAIASVALQGSLGIIVWATLAVMQANKSSMDAKKAELESYKNIKSQGILMDKQVERLIELIKPAVTTIQLMQGAFGAIAGDLKSIKDRVNEDIREADQIIADLHIENVLESWKSLQIRADQYRQVAYVNVTEGSQ